MNFMLGLTRKICFSFNCLDKWDEDAKSPWNGLLPETSIWDPLWPARNRAKEFSQLTLLWQIPSEQTLPSLISAFDRSSTLHNVYWRWKRSLLKTLTRRLSNSLSTRFYLPTQSPSCINWLIFYQYFMHAIQKTSSYTNGKQKKPPNLAS